MVLWHSIQGVWRIQLGHSRVLSLVSPDFLLLLLSEAAETTQDGCCTGCFSVPHIWTLYCRSIPITFNTTFSLHPHISSTDPQALPSCTITFLLPSTVLWHYNSFECLCKMIFLFCYFTILFSDIHFQDVSQTIQTLVSFAAGNWLPGDP